jgi:hypothetical protein
MTMLDQAFRALVAIPFFVVPIALIVWTVLQFSEKGGALKALIGLVVGAALCFGAFLLFLMNVYCENCADRPVSPREAVAVIAYVLFGVVMLLALWWTARPRNGARPGKAEGDVD